MGPGDIVLVKFPFTNLKSEKKRPALVLQSTPFSRSMDLYTIAMITSQVDGIQLKGDVHLKDWEGSGLLHPSIVRLSKLATVDSEIAERKLGTIALKDRKQIQNRIYELFSYWLQK